MAIETNLSDRWAAFSAFITLVRINFVKDEDFVKSAPAGIGGPNIGTFLDLVTATLKTNAKLITGS